MGFGQEEEEDAGFLLSSTDAEAKNFVFHRELRDFQKKLKRLQIFAAALGTLTILSLMLSTLLYHGSRSSKAPLVPSTVLVPKFPRRPVTFEENTIYSSAPSNESDEAWGRLVPKGRGYIYVSEPEKYYLHQGLDNDRNDGSQNYVISMFHQLHCIDILRGGYYSALTGKANQHSHTNTKHLAHCFDYLRQAVMCSGDTTLEWPSVEDDGSRHGATGWGITHECADFDRAFMWTEERRGTERTDIV